MALQRSLDKLMQGQSLTKELCQQTVDAILSKDVHLAQVAAFLALLRAKTETADELAGMVLSLQQAMIPVVTQHTVFDIVGTGGDGANTVNISTGSAILAASCGIKVVKHGNRAASSLAGSADVLEALGVAIDLTPKQIAASVDELGIGFCFAPNFHPALNRLRTLRQQLRIPTTFNLLGPLLNPARPSHVVLGVFDSTLLMPMAKALQTIGTTRSLIVHGCGLDEISGVGPATLLEVTPNEIKPFTLDPTSLGFSACCMADLQGGYAQENANILLAVLSGATKQHRAIADALILNAAAALYLSENYSSLIDAIFHAEDTLRSGAALTLLNHWRDYSHDQST